MAFRAASAEALAALEGELAGSAATSGAEISADLFSVAGTLRAEGALRRFATDASLASEAKSGVVQQVFGGKVNQTTLSLLTSAVGRRWTVGRDLADALEQLAVIALVKAIGDDAARLSDELFTFAQAVKDNPSLRDALSDPVRSNEDKRVLLRNLLGAQALPATLALAEQSVSGSHRTVGVALEAYQKVVAEAYGQGVATVRVARELSDQEQQRLADLLTRQYGRTIHLNLLIDPSVLGGIRVEIGDDVIDGTVSGRLDDARRRLAG